MASFMPVFNAANQLVILLFLAVFNTASYAAEHFAIEQANLTLTKQGYKLNAKINYPLTPRIIEAIDNGVPVTFTQTIRISRELPVVGSLSPWRQTVWEHTLDHQLRYHALSGQYILQTLDSDQQHNFLSLASALTEMGNIQDTLLFIPTNLQGYKQLEMMTEIDIHALPTPMRPGALISSKWQIDSPWVPIEWPE